MALGDGVLIVGASAVSSVAAFLLAPLAVQSVEDMRRRVAMQRKTGLGSASGASCHTQGDERGSFVTRALESSLDGIAAMDIPLLSRAARRFVGLRSGKLDQIREELPDALRALSASLASGQSFLQAFSYVAANTDEPLARELSQVVWDIRAGKGFGESFDGLKRRVPIPEVELLATVFSLQQRTGGSLQEMLGTAQQSIRGSLDMQRELKVQTASGRLSSRIVTVMPFVLLAFLALISPGYIVSFFTSPVGVMLFIAAVILDAVGLLAIRRILTIGS